ncbi:hypothetical protein QFC19_007643 [Naganishia cerealis]|uniref:Uncharacterized protein n=1 Tax=Naganishia cerealis TaxID=610337 RepID=A0ACC2V7T2_9TREE|nr:hypothetical protein QFC19_007643 [Naganishia cerealis]
MPEGPPPDAGGSAGNEQDSDSDDSIVMPEGTPPPEARLHSPSISQPAMPTLPHGGMPYNSGFPPHMPPMFAPPSGSGHFPPPMPYAHGAYQARPFAQGNGFVPPPPRGFFPGNPGLNPVRPGPGMGRGFRPPTTANLPPRPGGIVNDPLSDVPHQTYQAHRQARREEAQDNDSIAGGSAKNAPPPASAEISAAPQLRDLRKEATVFVPRAMKKKKPTANAQIITAAPVVSSAPGEVAATAPSSLSGNEGDRSQQLPHHSAPMPAATYTPAAAGGGLLSKLSGVLGTPTPAPAKKEKEDDYRAFLAGLEKLDQ